MARQNQDFNSLKPKHPDTTGVDGNILFDASALESGEEPLCTTYLRIPKVVVLTDIAHNKHMLWMNNYKSNT